MIRIMDLIPRVLTSDAATETAMDLADRVVFSLEKTLVGLLRVFLVLAILYAVVLILKIFFHDIPNRKRNGVEKRPTREEKRAERARAKALAEAEKRRRAAVAAPSDDAAIAAAIATAMMLEEDARLTAAITAAISVYLEEEAKATGTLPTGFRVVSYRRRGGGAWNRRR